MKHKIIMRPAGFGKIPDRFIPRGAKIIGAMTAAGLFGTIDPDGTVVPGLLSEDRIFVIEDVCLELINMNELLIPLKLGKVYRRLTTGILEYNIKAKLILVTQPFEPKAMVKEIFEIIEWKPKIAKLKEVKD